MGAEWSWPCGSREKIRYKVPIFQNTKDFKPDGLSQIKPSSIQVFCISKEFLNQELQKPIKDYLAVSICNHPLETDETLIIYEKLYGITDIHGSSYACPFLFSFDTIEKCKQHLQDSIFNMTVNGQRFLGVVGVSGHYLLSFFKPIVTRNLYENISVSFLEEVSKNSLERFLNKSLMEYKGFLAYKGANFIIMQESNKDKKKFYFVAKLEFSNKDITNFENFVANSIEEYLDRNLEFKGTLSYKSSIFLIFNHKLN